MVFLSKESIRNNVADSAGPDEAEEPYLSEEEIREQALSDRKKRAETEAFTVIQGDMFKGDHLVVNKNNREYRVTLHDPKTGAGHCSCPDYLTNGLGTCKHIRFGLFKSGVLIGDEMGLGKTLQAISLGLLKKEIFGFSKIVVVTLASLKEQWKREIEKFSHEKAGVIAGNPSQRKAGYFNDDCLFKITNYEAVLRDVTILSSYNPDLIILDEAQRIKNFSTKTADAVKRIPKRHAIVLTGTPLENKLEDVYSIVQFLDPYLLTPLWKFAADHFLFLKNKKSQIAGYRNLDLLKKKLKGIVIRRKKEDVLKDLPDEVVNNYYIDLNREQLDMHAVYARSLMPLINKKYLTSMDLRKIQVLLLRMRMVCDSTYLIDRKTQISPKLKELDGIIDEFTNNPECRVFLSTDAGGTGLNLQAADCVVNFELSWNPARMNQRIGRVSRIGQASGCINVINLIAKSSIEERILAGIQLKTDLFKGVFDDDGPDAVAFSREKREEMLNRLRAMMGETPEPEGFVSSDPEEIPEDTPCYLNPKVLDREEEMVEKADQGATGVFDGQSPEKIETVLNSGMEFIGGLMEMATGRKIERSTDQEKMIQIDKETGEVTMKFKLPGG